MQDKTHLKHVVIIFIVALVARVLFTFFIYEPLSVRYFPKWVHPPGQFSWNSDDKYDQIAKNLIAGNGFTELGGTDKKLYPSLSRTPVYPLVLAVQFYLFGDGFWVNVLINIIYQCLSGVILYYFTLLIFNKVKTALVSSAIWALYPLPMLHATGPHTEAFYGLELILFAYYFYKFCKFRETRHLIVSSVFLAILTLTKPISLLFPLFFIGIILLNKEYHYPLRTKIKQSIIMSLIFLIALVPWIYRGYAITGELIPLVTYKKPLNYYIVKKVYPKELQTGATADFRDEIKNPVVFVIKLIDRLVKFWYDGKTPATTMVNALLQFPLLFFSGLGIWMAKKQKYLISPVLLIILYFWITYSMIHSISRYSFPLVLLLSPFMATTILNYKNYFKGKTEINS